MAPENLHLTLKFLGEVEATRVADLADTLAATVSGVPAFTLVLRGLGAFPSPERPRVIWAGTSEGADRLALLATRIEDALNAVGVPRETRPFAAHVTLGRIRLPRRAPALATALRAAASLDFGRLRVGRVSLMRSELSPRGARYTELASTFLNIDVGDAGSLECS